MTTIIPTGEDYSSWSDPGNGLSALTVAGNKRGWRQTGRPKDYNLALSYERSHGETLSAFYLGPPAYNKPVYSVRATHAMIGSQIRLSSQLAGAKNRAYAKVLEAWKPIKAESGVTLAQMGEAAGMVAARSVQLLSASRSLLRGDIKQFLNTLFTLNPSMKNGIPKEFLPKGMIKGKNPRGSIQMSARTRRLLEARWKRKVVSDAGGVWLEAWFGWLPAINDMHSAAETLVTPILDQRYSGASGDKMNIGLGNGVAEAEFILRYSGSIEVTNRNLALAESLGLLNPFSIAWDLVKFSWLIGWFGNFQQVIGSWTDHAGIKAHNQSTTLYATWTATLQEKTVEYPPGYLHSKSAGYFVIRSVEPMAYPTLQTKIPQGLSVTRAATAIALLVQNLGKMSSK